MDNKRFGWIHGGSTIWTTIGMTKLDGHICHSMEKLLCMDLHWMIYNFWVLCHLYWWSDSGITLLDVEYGCAFL